MSLYLRQSKQRIFDEISFYASPLGLSPEALLELIYQDPHGAEQKIREQFDLPRIWLWG
ncbi:MAG: hypothetical protein HC825_04710 [Oscillatoriales cyanobacterium RM1_1_9]|nr:hypothetical protein [Oscillatoriales cyanobacterium RM1_1_9]